MKRTILASIGIAATMAVQSAHATGSIILDNYTASGNLVVYGGSPFQIPGTIAGNGIQNGSGPNGIAGNVTWTIGVYAGIGNISVPSDPYGFEDPGTLSGGALTQLTGAPGDTSTLVPFSYGAGYFANFPNFSSAQIPGYTSGLVTFEVVAYSGTSYDDSLFRGHSSAFTLTPATGIVVPPYISSSTGGMPTFGVYRIMPEPSAFALSGIATALLLVCRKKNCK